MGDYGTSSVVDPDPADPDPAGSETFYRIRIRQGPKLFVGSGVGYGINHFGSGSGQPLSRMNLKQNFSNKIHNFSTKCKIILKKSFFPKKVP
jgi:hypothetical protein